MACNKCGHTKSSPCACNDHGLTTPCSFTNCTTSTCEEVYCYECVVDCFKNSGRQTNVWGAEIVDSTNSDPANEFSVHQGDSVLKILQKLALRVTDPAGPIVSAQLAITPVTIDNVTSTSLKLNWGAPPSTVTSISIYQAAFGSTSYSLVTTLTTNLASTLSYDVTNLTPNTNYKYKLISTGLYTPSVGAAPQSGSANSATVYVGTLAS